MTPVEREARAFRGFELLLVTGVAFGASIWASLSALHAGSAGGALQYTFDRLGLQILHEILGIGLLYYVLACRSRTWKSIGLRLSWTDIPTSIALVIVAWLCYAGVYTALVPLLQHFGGSFTTFHLGGFKGSHFELLTVVLIALNPMFEELIVRAYLISTLKSIGAPMAVAILASVGLQTSYHLYQGVAPALALSAMFLIFSAYYAKTGRITPIILAHLYVDALAVLRSH